MGALHQNLLYHTEVRWLSKGNMLTRVIELKSELNMFFEDGEYVNLFNNPKWLLKLAFIADIFRHLNILNTSMQGRDENVISAKDKIKAFILKIEMWSTSLQQLQFHSFDSFESIAAEISSDELVSDFIPTMIEALQNLKKELYRYFPKEMQEDKGDCWVLNPFISNCIELADLDNILKEKLCELAADSMLKMEYLSENSPTFWIKRKLEYPELAKKALRILTQFSTSYLCEMTFSQMVNIKTKKRNKLELENDLIVCVSQMQPRFSLLVKNKQAHRSH